LGNWEFNQGQKDGLFLEKEGSHLWTCQTGKWHIHTKIPGHSRQLKFHHKAQTDLEDKVPHNYWKATSQTMNKQLYSQEWLNWNLTRTGNDKKTNWIENGELTGKYTVNQIN